MSQTSEASPFEKNTPKTSEKNRPDIGQKTLIGLLGPIGSGKTLLKQAILKRAPEFDSYAVDNQTDLSQLDAIGTYSIGPILSENIEDLGHTGLKDFHPVFVLASGALYHHRLVTKYLHQPDIRTRLAEGQETVNFAKRNLSEGWLNFIDIGDSDESLHLAALDIVRMTHQRTHLITADAYSLDLLDQMQETLQRVAREVQ